MTIGSLVRWYDMAAARSTKEDGESVRWTAEEVENARDQRRQYQGELDKIEREIRERRASGEPELSDEMQRLTDRAAECRAVIETIKADLAKVEACGPADRVA